MVNIGFRQKNRERGFNVIDVGHDKNEIYNAIIKQMKRKKIKKSNLYGDGFSQRKIAKILNNIFKKEVSVEKVLNYL